MSCFISELLIPENIGSLPMECCRKCRRRKECPCVYDRDLCRAAHQGRVAARLLTEKANQHVQTIFNADNIRGLLQADEALERALSQALCSEMALIGSLSLSCGTHWF